MNFLDHNLPDAAQNYLDSLAYLFSKQVQQNNFIEKSQLENTGLTQQIKLLSTHLAEQAALLKTDETKIETLFKHISVLNDQLLRLAKAQEATGSAVQAMMGKPVTSAQVLKDAYMGLQPKATALMADRYRDNGDGTVTDVSTGLQWMRFALGQTWQAGKCTGAARKFHWNGAKAAAEAINRETGYAGCRDWRLPSKEELLSLVYCSSGKPKTWNDTGWRCEGNYQKPTVFQPAFPNTPSVYFWSGTPDANDSSRAWDVYFNNGFAYGSSQDSESCVRLVRSAA